MNLFLETCLVVLALLVAGAAVRAVRGPRFTDRIVAINLLTTMTLSMICILTLLRGEDFFIDVAIIYALISFVTVAVMAKIIIRRRKEQIIREKKLSEKLRQRQEEEEGK